MSKPGGSYAIRVALRALVELKEHKDKHGKTEYYKRQQPRAWARARRALRLKRN